MTAFTRDAKRFTLHNRPTIEKEPLQIYSSALIFTPQHSIVRRQFRKQVQTWIKRLPTVPKRWSPLLQTFEPHRHPLRHVVSAPDGKFLASACDQTIKLWDPAAGACCQTLTPDGRIESLAFTADARMLSVRSTCYCPDNTTHDTMQKLIVEAWDTVTGTSTVLHTLTFHQHACEYKPLSVPRTCALSPDGKTLAVPDGDINDQPGLHSLLRLWNMKVAPFPKRSRATARI